MALGLFKISWWSRANCSRFVRDLQVALLFCVAFFSKVIMVWNRVNKLYFYYHLANVWLVHLLLLSWFHFSQRLRQDCLSSIFSLIQKFVTMDHLEHEMHVCDVTVNFRPSFESFLSISNQNCTWRMVKFLNYCNHVLIN